MICKESIKNEYGEFLAFESLTLFPISKKLIETKLLSSKELDWLNNYHSHVFDQLSPSLSESEKEWLKDKCSVI